MNTFKFAITVKWPEKKASSVVAKGMERTGEPLPDAGIGYLGRWLNGEEITLLLLLCKLKMLKLLLKDLLLYFTETPEQSMSHLDLNMVPTGTQITSRTKMIFSVFTAGQIVLLKI